MKHSIISLIIIFCAAVFLSGCGNSTVENPNRTEAKGRVMYQGAALRCGSVCFVSQDNPSRRATCGIDSDGTFALDIVPKGEVLISVETESVKQGGDESLYVKIPAKYEKIKTSGLTMNIPDGGNEDLVITLESGNYPGISGEQGAVRSEE